MIRLLQGDCREVLGTLPAESVQCCVTSPPYFGLRDYGTGQWEGGSAGCNHIVGEIRTGLGMVALGEKYRGGGKKAAASKPMMAKDLCPKCGATRLDNQIGLEQTPAEYVAQLVEVFREVRRVLRPDGTCWVNLGDAYANGGKWGGSTGGKHVGGREGTEGYRVKRHTGLKPKDLMGIPWRVAFALQDDGWWLRADIIWSKPNPMPESVRDRPTKSHEYLFLFAKAERYFYDAKAIAEPLQTDPKENYPARAKVTGRGTQSYTTAHNGAPSQDKSGGFPPADDLTRNARSVWTIATQPYSEAHFATFPAELARRCILAGTRPGDTVLDPFAGAGTTLLVADREKRDGIGIELNPDYVELARRRISGDAPLLADVA